MEKKTGTILKIYLLAKTAAGKEEGMVELWKHKGKKLALTRQKSHFNFPKEIPDKVRALLEKAKIPWPNQP
jgi:hypothetical protein